MHSVSKLLVTGLITIGLVAPLAVMAAGLPFGGRVLSAVPCSGGLYVSILSVPIIVSGLSGISIVASPQPVGTVGFYIWKPGSLTYSFGPPRPGVQILGLSDVPTSCFIGNIPVFGLRMQILGTSLVI